MPQSLCFFFKRSFEFLHINDIDQIPARVRAIYVLYKADKKRGMNVVYVGMARGDKTGAKGRLRSHRDSKAGSWDHFSVFEVWDNIPPQIVEELEGLFRHIYRLDAEANILNKQRAHSPFNHLRKQTKSEKHG